MDVCYRWKIISITTIVEEDQRRKTLLKSIEKGGEGWGILFFISGDSIISFMTFLSDVGGHLDL